MNCQVLTDRRSIDELSGEWNRLLAQSTLDHVFLTWEWVSAWLETIGHEAEPLVLTARDGQEQLCGLLPLYRARLSLLGLLPMRALRVMGDGSCGGEYGGLIARRDIEAQVIESLLMALRENRWDLSWVPNTGPTDSFSAGLLSTAQRLGITCRTRPAEFAHIPLPGTFEKYTQLLAAKVRYQMRRGVERAEGDHGATPVPCRRLAELAGALAELRRLHELRWTRRGQHGAFADGRKREFYLRLSEHMLNRNWLRLDFLHVDGRAVAAQIGFAYHGTFYELQRGFDPSFAKIPAGVGAALRWMVIRRCIEEGIHTYDFLGECTEDKLRAGAVRTYGRDILLTGPSLRGALIKRLAVWPTGRYLKEESFSATPNQTPRPVCKAQPAAQPAVAAS